MFATHRRPFTSSHPFPKAFGPWGLWQAQGLGDLFADLERLERSFAQPAQAERPHFAARVQEEGDHFVLTAQLPGLALEDLKVSVLEDTVTISGERKPQVPEGFTVRRQERKSGRFSRSFRFRVPLDAERVEATLKDGILSVTLPRLAAQEGRQIEIKRA